MPSHPAIGVADRSGRPKAVVVGAGPVGCLAAQVLSRHGYLVEMYEKRPHLLHRGIATEGRTINLSISPRGVRALAAHGGKANQLSLGVPMDGRAIHMRSGKVVKARYGEAGWCNYSVDRHELNLLLLQGALRDLAITVRFGARCNGVEFDARRVFFDVGDYRRVAVDYQLLVGADGAGSTVRDRMAADGLLSFDRSQLDVGYQEVMLWPATTDPDLMNAIHIWPRDDFFMVALPNRDGSLRGTLVLPATGPHSFVAMRQPGDLDRLFARHLPDVRVSFPSGDRRQPAPVAGISVVSCSALVHRDSVLLAGDAAHTIAPFLGQGVNLGMEDCLSLASLLDRHLGDPSAVLAEYERDRLLEGRAAAELSMANYMELRHGTGGTDRSHPGSLPVAVNFLGLSYQEVLDREFRQSMPADRPGT